MLVPPLPVQVSFSMRGKSTCSLWSVACLAKELTECVTARGSRPLPHLTISMRGFLSGHHRSPPAVEKGTRAMKNSDRTPGMRLGPMDQEGERGMRLLVCKDESEDGLVWHAVEERRAKYDGHALCGTKPARDWSAEDGGAVTCPRCLRIKAVIGT